MSRPAILAQGLGKHYRLGEHVPYRTLREMVSQAVAASFRGRRRRGPGPASEDAQEIWALRDLSFEVRPGEALGIIGANGAGKTTLLRILARITEPTEGSASIAGRIGSLLEVGTGFHPELTGRENVYLNGAVLGMKRAEIRRKFDEIIAFSGVERFVETPVKHYSSGMYMRLAFAVAAHLQTEILLVDEVLAVGDAAFQLKCLNKMSEVTGGGKTILFVSHNMEAVTKLCGSGLLLEGGKMVLMGTPQACIDRYLLAARERGRSHQNPVSLGSHPGRRKQHNGPVRLTSVALTDHHGQLTCAPVCGKPFTVTLDYELVERAQEHEEMFLVTFTNLYDRIVACCRSHETAVTSFRVSRNGAIACRIPRLPLVPGSYRLTVGCTTEAGFSDSVYDAAAIEVIGNAFYPSGALPKRDHGDVMFDHEWSLQDAESCAALEMMEE